MRAGVASAVMGVAQLGIGAGLAAVVDAQIDTTVTPMLVGAVSFGMLGWVALRLATGSPETPGADVVDEATASAQLPQSPMGSSTMPSHT